MKQNSRQYLLLTIFFLLLSLAAFAGINWLKLQPAPNTAPLDDLSPTPVQEPGLDSQDLESNIQEPAPTTTPTTSINNQPPARPAGGSPIDDLIPTPTFQFFTSSADNFSVTYSSSRKLYQDTEANQISRYTFYRSNSSFAIHVGQTWVWQHPNRDFSGNFLVSGQNTFRFDTAGQTIIDIDYRGKKYTIQCLHGDESSQKAECDNFIKSFKLQ